VIGLSWLAHHGRAMPIRQWEVEPVKEFSNASFAPAEIAIMTGALDIALSMLPHPVGSSRVQSIAETILRTAREGERDPAILARMALLELQISPREDRGAGFLPGQDEGDASQSRKRRREDPVE